MRYIVVIAFVLSSLFSFGQNLLVAYSDIYIVVADSGSNFTELDDKAYAASKVLEVAYYSNKRYDAKKGLIYSDEFITENKHDFVEYSHRRFATNDVSIERIEPYFDSIPKSKSMLVIAVMFTKKQDADKTLFELSKFFPRAFIYKKEMYLGCDY